MCALLRGDCRRDIGRKQRQNFTTYCCFFCLTVFGRDDRALLQHNNIIITRTNKHDNYSAAGTTDEHKRRVARARMCVRVCVQCTVVGEHMETGGDGGTAMTVAPGTAAPLLRSTRRRRRRHVVRDEPHLHENYDDDNNIILSCHIPSGSRSSSVPGCCITADRPLNNEGILWVPPTIAMVS